MFSLRRQRESLSLVSTAQQVSKLSDTGFRFAAVQVVFLGGTGFCSA